MFTGFIVEIGEIVSVDAEKVEIRAPKAASGLRPGGSVCGSGVCLSAERIEGDRFQCSITSETARRSALGELHPGDRINVELPLRAGDALDGHLVQGHVDAVSKIVRIDEEPSGRRLWIRPPERVLRELVPKGSIAVDGVSLTIAEVVRDRFSVALIPSTLRNTTLVDMAVGQRVNLETDLIGKLAMRHGDTTSRALTRSISNLPWAGVVTGSTGVEKVLTQLRAGGGILVWDPDKEHEGDVIFAGAALRPGAFAFMLTQACGHTTVPCEAGVLERLEIPPMPGPGDHQGTAMHVSVDLAAAQGTGVSAAERAATVRRLAHPDARPSDFVAPGHVFPLSARPLGLRERQGHTEATVALCRGAGLPGVGVCCEIMSRDGTMAGPAELERFALDWGLPLIDLRELVERL